MHLCRAQRRQEAPRPHRVALLVALAAGWARALVMAVTNSAPAHFTEGCGACHTTTAEEGKVVSWMTSLLQC